MQHGERGMGYFGRSLMDAAWKPEYRPWRTRLHFFGALFSRIYPHDMNPFKMDTVDLTPAVPSMCDLMMCVLCILKVDMDSICILSEKYKIKNLYYLEKHWEDLYNNKLEGLTVGEQQLLAQLIEFVEFKHNRYVQQGGLKSFSLDVLRNFSIDDWEDHQRNLAEQYPGNIYFWNANLPFHYDGDKFRNVHQWWNENWWFELTDEELEEMGLEWDID